jgi:hypothetical protein
MKNTLSIIFAALAVALLAAPSQTEANARILARHGVWEIFERTDEFTDKITYIAVTTQNRLDIMLSVVDGEARALYHFGTYFAGDRDNEVIVRYRVDRKPSVNPEYWPLLTPEKRSAMVIGEKAERFFQNIRGGQRLVIRATDPHDDEAVTAEFHLRGIDDVLADLHRRSRN